MATMTLWGSLRDYGLTLIEKARDKPTKAVLLVTLFVGGILLLAHVLAIGELPEFTWNDITGTLIAVFVASTFFTVMLVAYTLFAGLSARSVLEGFYPEAATHPDGRMSGPIALWPSYARLLRGFFVPGVTCFVALAWLTVFLGFASDRLKPPHDHQLHWALLVAWGAIACLLLLDWTRFKRQIVRHVILGAWFSAVAVLSLLLGAWSIAPERFAQQKPHSAVAPHHSFDWVGTLTWMLDHIVAIAIVVMVSVLVLMNLRRIGGWIKPLISPLRKTPVWAWGGAVAKNAARLGRFLFGDASDRRMIRAKLSIMAVLCVLALCILVPAFGLANSGDAHYATRNFFFALIMVTELNWGAYMIRTWKGRAALGTVTAFIILFGLPALMGNPLFFPKAMVSVLALGNEHWVSVSLSSEQCSTLAPYGVHCVSDNEHTITLTDVNVLNRLGSNVVLELLVKDGGDSKDHRGTAIHTSDKGMTVSGHADALPSATTLLANYEIGPGSEPAKRCDKVLLSRLEPKDPIDEDALRCVKMVVPKDQIAGHTAAGRSTYRSAYTAYMPGPDKGPTVVKFEDDTHASAEANTEQWVISAVVR